MGSSGVLPGAGAADDERADQGAGALGEAHGHGVEEPVDTDISVAAHAVNDVVRLVAELRDNATWFSPPNTTVVADGRRIRDYVLVQVEDRGLGLSDEQLDSLNRRLAAAPGDRRQQLQQTIAHDQRSRMKNVADQFGGANLGDPRRAAEVGRIKWNERRAPRRGNGSGIPRAAEASVSA